MESGWVGVVGGTIELEEVKNPLRHLHHHPAWGILVMAEEYQSFQQKNPGVARGSEWSRILEVFDAIAEPKRPGKTHSPLSLSFHTRESEVHRKKECNRNAWQHVLLSPNPPVVQFGSDGFDGSQMIDYSRI